MSFASVPILFIIIILLRRSLSATAEPNQTIFGMMLGVDPGITVPGQFRGFESRGAHRPPKSVDFRPKWVTSWRIARCHAQSTEYFPNLK